MSGDGGKIIERAEKKDTSSYLPLSPKDTRFARRIATRLGIRDKQVIEQSLPYPYDQTLLFPSGELHALITPQKILQYRTGEGNIHLVQVAYEGKAGQREVLNAVEKEIS